jgi:predicted ArsR family transcriptional regulator
MEDRMSVRAGILTLLGEYDALTCDELAEKLNVPRRKVVNSLSGLISRGRVVATGPARGRKYKLFRAQDATRAAEERAFDEAVRVAGPPYARGYRWRLDPLEDLELAQ